MSSTLAVMAGLSAAPVAAQDSLAGTARTRPVEVTPWFGFDFGGAVWDPFSGSERSFDASPAYGLAVSFAIGEEWRVEALYSRQPTQVEGGGRPPLDVTIERYLAGVQEETGEGDRLRWFGSLWVGATRFVPGLQGYGSETQFGAGLALGGKVFLSRRLGLRFEGRAFFTDVNSDAGVFCANGTCLFAFAASGIWQGDASAGLIVVF